ncbi:sigma factor [Amycolatopsis sp. NBRC 101858]|uniref:sigma factor n=1 Tax=Amycolatopsis sp. NBRC 101858 TaxID=3032200 RepID=UPI00255518FA|nr:sigma factor [Amycolatopsis sp. NBRC 101858]
MTATHDEAADAPLVAFERFVRMHHVTVFRLASCLLGDPAGAEEVTEEVFVGLWHGQRRPPSTADLFVRTVDHCLDKAAPTALFTALRRFGGPERTGWLLADVLHFPAARTAELLERSETEFTPRLEATRLALTHWLAP